MKQGEEGNVSSTHELSALNEAIKENSGSRDKGRERRRKRRKTEARDAAEKAAEKEDEKEVKCATNWEPRRNAWNPNNSI